MTRVVVVTIMPRQGAAGEQMECACSRTAAQRDRVREQSLTIYYYQAQNMYRSHGRSWKLPLIGIGGLQ